MEIQEKTRRENPLHPRTEVEFEIHHPGEATPERDSVRNLVADHVGGDPESTIVDHMDTEFGRATTVGYAKVYESSAEARQVEPEHMLERNGLEA
jgi:small subunit ribosomal protein S24e